jgi:crotonobetainyl-CoA:carnitine CoA-transferase CaiB-like acyl-CoA transferase
MGALNGLKVIDLSRVLGGPYCTQFLADHGATVIKVEPPQGDETRDWGPPFKGDAASYFIGINRNKQAIALDLTKEEGREVLMTLLSEADVLVENFKPGTLERWGIGYEQCLSGRFPRLIHCRVSGFGGDGPLGGLPGYDAVIQAMCGLMSVNGEKGGLPLRMGVPVVDIVTGLNATIGVLLALQERQLSGQGQFVEATLFDSGLSLMHPHVPNYLLSGKVGGPTGNAHPNICPYDSFPTRTCHVFLAVGNDTQFARLCKQLSAAELASDERFRTNGARLTNAAALRALLEGLMLPFDGEELASELMRKGVPCGPVLDVHGALGQPHSAARGRVVEIGTYRGVASPVSLSRTPPSYRTPPPSFGQDTAEVLRSVGYGDSEIEALEGQKITPKKRNI